MTYTVIDIDVTDVKAEFINDKTIRLEVPTEAGSKIPDRIHNAADQIASEAESEIMYHALYESVVKQFVEFQTLKFLQQRIK